MSDIKICINGAYPRSEQLVQFSRDHDRKRIDDTKLQEQFCVDRENLVSLQRTFNFDYINDGLLNWQDDLRPFIEACEGVNKGALVRYFNTNSFYRQPVIDKEVSVNLDTLKEYFTFNRVNHNKLVSLPSPISFSEMSVGDSDSLNTSTGILEDVTTWIAEQGCELILFKEPWLAYNSQSVSKDKMKSYMSSFKQLINSIKSKNDNTMVGIHFSFGDAQPLMNDVLDVPFDVVGIDFLETDLESIKQFDWTNKEILAGCVNGRNSLLEEPTTLFEFVNKLQTELKPKGLTLTNSVDLSFIPECIAKKKLAILGNVKDQLNKKDNS